MDADIGVTRQRRSGGQPRRATQGQDVDAMLSDEIRRGQALRRLGLGWLSKPGLPAGCFTVVDSALGGLRGACAVSRT